MLNKYFKVKNILISSLGLMTKYTFDILAF